MRKSIETMERARNILIKDKLDLPDGFRALLVGDISSLLSHYFELTEPFAKVKIDVDQDGSYIISAVCKAERVKEVPFCLPEFD